MSTDTIQLTCPCGRTLAVPRATQGKIAQCPACGHQIAIPMSLDAPSDSSGTDSAMSINPYAPASALPESPIELPDDLDAVRRYYLSFEARIKGMGWLYMFGAIAIWFIGLSTVLQEVRSSTTNPPPVFNTLLALLIVAIGIGQFAIGLGLRNFNSVARYAAIGFSGLGLMNFPVGTMVSVYFLYLLLSKKGQMIFSPSYKEIIAATPHVRYRTPTYVWAVAVAFVLLLVVTALIVAIRT